jgi:hypothetical protein
MVTAVQQMHQAVGNKEAADRMNAIAKEMASNSQPSADQYQQWLKTIDANPVDSSRLSAVKDAKSKQFLVQSAGYIAVAAAFNAKAVNTARQLASMKPGIADAASAPALLGTANVVVTTVPAELEHIAKYGALLASYMKDNKLTPPSEDEKLKIAKASGADNATAAAILAKS